MTTNSYQDIYVFIEQHQGTCLNVGYELLQEAQKLVAQIPNMHYNVVGVLLGYQVQANSSDIIAYGADKLIVCDDPHLAQYSTQYYTDALTQIIEQYHPDSFLIGATAVGRDLAPRVAARVNTGLTADATKIEIDTTQADTATLLVTRPAFGGNLFGTIVCKTRPQMATIRPNVMELGVKDSSRVGEVIQFQPVWNTGDEQVKLLERIEKQQVFTDITKARIILSCGRGMVPHMDLMKQIADDLGAQIAVSRAVVDQGKAHKDIQVGQTGKTVRPTVYIACGISGAAQHIAGMEQSEFIIAINKDPHAPIFQIANLGIVGDAVEILPLLKEELLCSKEK